MRLARAHDRASQLVSTVRKGDGDAVQALKRSPSRASSWRRFRAQTSPTTILSRYSFSSPLDESSAFKLVQNRLASLPFSRAPATTLPLRRARVLQLDVRLRSLDHQQGRRFGLSKESLSCVLSALGAARSSDRPGPLTLSTSRPRLACPPIDAFPQPACRLFRRMRRSFSLAHSMESTLSRAS